MEKNYERGSIINYLTVEYMKQAEDHSNPATRVRTAYIKALKKFYRLSELEKQNIINKIKE